MRSQTRRLLSLAGAMFCLGVWPTLVIAQPATPPAADAAPDSGPPAASPLASDTAADADARAAERIAQFEREVRPVLAGQCIQCHGESKQEGGLRLDSLDGFLQGGDSGPAIVPGKPDESILVDAIHYRGSEMPPTGKLANKQILHIERWIANGAHWPKNGELLRKSEGAITEGDRQWWAFQPLRQPDVPIDPEDAWSKTPVDRFVWQKLRENKLSPAPMADRAVLLRRLYFDLIGLPPTPAEMDAFLADGSETAIEQVVDRLLEDPRYGEHWARFWLDLVRYSESDGWNLDSYRPAIWKYRDYVVGAFNKDLPYPQFVLDQLAGDESPTDHPDGLIAAGFLRLGVYEYNQRDARAMERHHERNDRCRRGCVLGDERFLRSMPSTQIRSHSTKRLFQASSDPRARLLAR